MEESWKAKEETQKGNWKRRSRKGRGDFDNVYNEEEEGDEETLVPQKRSQTPEEEFSDEEINYMMQHIMPKVLSRAVLCR